MGSGSFTGSIVALKAQLATCQKLKFTGRCHY